MRTNIVLIDLESVQPDTLAKLAKDHFKVLVFVGAGQSKLPFELAASLQRLGERAEYIKITGNGPNALDFHIAFYLGKLAAGDPTAYFHIISKDSGFDPLIQHLKANGVLAGRVTTVEEIPVVKSSSTKSAQDRLCVALDWLSHSKVPKPRSIRTLHSSIQTLFQKQLTIAEVEALVSELERLGHLVLDGKKVAYRGAGAD